MKIRTAHIVGYTAYMLKTALEFCLDFLFPKLCVTCFSEGAMICASCEAAIPTVTAVCFVCERRSPTGEICPQCKGRTRLRRFVAPLPYREGAVRELIHTLKYRGVREISEILARFITTYVKEMRITLPGKTILVPIPLHRKRLRERGFNQAEIIAKSLGESLSIPLQSNILKRAKYAPPQTTMKTRKERKENAKDLYAVAAPVPDGATIILVDDVSTTGATLEEAARVLKEAGAAQVWAFTAAR